MQFLSTPSARRATKKFIAQPGNREFLSTPSARRATRVLGKDLVAVPISIHALREEGDRSDDASPAPAGSISIHALREEGDQRMADFFRRISISIHALREEGDIRAPFGRRMSGYFYPRPPRGGRHSASFSNSGTNDISIHALREEGDVPSIV